MMLASSGNNENGSLASRVIAVDNSHLSWTITGDEEFQTDLIVRGNGPILASNSANSRIRPNVLDEVTFTFLTESRVYATQMSDMYTLGILRNGSYEISRSGGSGLVGETVINGSDMLGFVSGNMSRSL
jgi:hypothetical protein